MSKLLKSLLLFAVVMLIAGFIVSRYLSSSTQSTVDGLHQEIKESGDPLYFTEYETAPIPDDENAYFHLTQAKPGAEAFDTFLLEIGSDNFHSSLMVPGGMSHQTMDELAKRIDDNSEVFGHLDRAAQCTQFRPDMDYSEGFAAELSHIPAFRSATRALMARAIVLASQDDGDGALRTCVTGLRIQQHLANDPTLVASLTSIAAQNQFLDAAHHVLVTTQTSAAARKELDQTLSEIDNPGRLKDALKGERALGILSYQQIREGQIESLDGPSSSMPGFLSGTGFGQAYFNDDEAAYIRLMNQYIDLVRRPRAERTPILESMEAELRENGFRHVVTRMLVPSLLSAINSIDRVEARLRCLQVVLALQDQGELGSVVIPSDPFTGIPLVVKQVDEDWLVYSVGPNLQDDQGDFSIEKGAYESLDIGFGPDLAARKVDDISTKTVD